MTAKNERLVGRSQRVAAGTLRAAHGVGVRVAGRKLENRRAANKPAAGARDLGAPVRDGFQKLLQLERASLRGVKARSLLSNFLLELGDAALNGRGVTAQVRLDFARFFRRCADKVFHG